MKRALLALVACFALVAGLGACDRSPRPPAYDAIYRTFPSAQHNKAIAVAKCESGMNPRAVSPGGGNHGLFQINSVHRSMVQQMGYSWSRIYDPYVNAHVARTLWRQSGWGPWGCA